MPLTGILNNPVFIACITASVLAQILKLPLEYLRTKKWDWSLIFGTGGVPSSHSAVVTAAAAGVGHYVGFDTPLFGLAFAIATVVIYDATNIRRQAGFHAQQINRIIEEIFAGKVKPVDEFNELREVLGHSPGEAVGGIILGIIISWITWQIWP
ncbi:MAG: divergent PAP2 family protein [Brevefilum sp.]|nr:divergent PAP2 family protein [Brevefilum sp.]MDW7753999.1 divergent PAP2 family protein [Brevefilum sp.]